MITAFRGFTPEVNIAQAGSIRPLSDRSDKSLFMQLMTEQYERVFRFKPGISIK